MKLYAGIDLHSTNSYVIIINEANNIIYDKRLPNDIEVIKHELEAYKSDLTGLVIESTYNWYWLVDGLQEVGYVIHLANPGAIQQYKGIKHTGDKTDARWLAELLKLNILPSGYIYPKEIRGLRDLLRKRSQLVRHQTVNILSIKTTVERNTSIRLSSNTIKRITEEDLGNKVDDEDIKLALASNQAMLHTALERIDLIEKRVLKKIKPTQTYKNLLSVNGIGKVLAFTIILETGDINRFQRPGNYASYCRCVSSERISNGKKKGVNNRKNGNKYLSWAYVEAANFAIRYSPIIKKYYQKKTQKTNSVIAIKTIAHKLARASYFIMRDNCEFDVHKSFG